MNWENARLIVPLIIGVIAGLLITLVTNFLIVKYFEDTVAELSRDNARLHTVLAFRRTVCSCEQDMPIYEAPFIAAKHGI